MAENQIFITKKDYTRINDLFEECEFQAREALETELERAAIIEDTETPRGLMTMNSKCRYLNVTDNREVITTVVYPKESNAQDGKVSIFAPIGSALIGLQENQEIEWTFPHGKHKKIRLLEVIYQPERSGDWHL